MCKKLSFLSPLVNVVIIFSRASKLEFPWFWKITQIFLIFRSFSNQNQFPGKFQVCGSPAYVFSDFNASFYHVLLVFNYLVAIAFSWFCLFISHIRIMYSFLFFSLWLNLKFSTFSLQSTFPLKQFSATLTFLFNQPFRWVSY